MPLSRPDSQWQKHPKLIRRDNHQALHHSGVLFEKAVERAEARLGLARPAQHWAFKTAQSLSNSKWGCFARAEWRWRGDIETNLIGKGLMNACVCGTP